MTLDGGENTLNGGGETLQRCDAGRANESCDQCVFDEVLS